MSSSRSLEHDECHKDATADEILAAFNALRRWRENPDKNGYLGLYAWDFFSARSRQMPEDLSAWHRACIHEFIKNDGDISLDKAFSLGEWEKAVNRKLNSCAFKVQRLIDCGLLKKDAIYLVHNHEKPHFGYSHLAKEHTRIMKQKGTRQLLSVIANDKKVSIELLDKYYRNCLKDTSLKRKVGDTLRKHKRELLKQEIAEITDY